MADTLTMQNRDLSKMYRALVILGNRRMANLSADLKVARLIRALAVAVEPLEALKRRDALSLIEGFGDPAELTPSQEQVLNLKVAEAQAEIDAATVEVVVPMAYALKEADLPREGAGKDGAVNASQIGAIVADLGPLFLLDEE